jgi:hypothetical protein
MSASAGIYNALQTAALGGLINVHVDKFALVLVNERYRADLKNHTRRSDVMAYAIHDPVKITADIHSESGAVQLRLGGARLQNVRLEPRASVYFRSGENDPSDDVLMAINDYGRTISCGDSGTLVIDPIVLEFGYTTT